MKLDPDLRDMYLDVWVCNCGTFIPVKKGPSKKSWSYAINFMNASTL